MNFCACNCGELVTGTWKRGHANVLRIGSNNPGWKGDDVSIKALHGWLKDNWPGGRSFMCQKCGLRPSYDLANIRPDINPETYTRDFKNWWWACRSCHVFFDGRSRGENGAWYGKKRPEHAHKMKVKFTGKNNPNYGKAAWNRGKKGYMVGPNKGKKFSDEWRKNISNAKKKCAGPNRDPKTGRFVKSEE